MHDAKDSTQSELIQTQKKDIKKLKVRVVWVKIKSTVLGALMGILIMVL